MDVKDCYPNQDPKVMRSIIACESQYNQYAIASTSKEFSVGLVQINIKAHPSISINQARSPMFALNFLASEMAKGNLFICDACPNLIREIETYVWDVKKSQQGEDAPVKKDDHACVVGDTLVMTDKGEVAIQDLVGIGEFSILNAKDKNIVEDICFVAAKTILMKSVRTSISVRSAWGTLGPCQ